MEDPLTEALERLPADDPELAREAEAVWNALTWGEGVEVIDQASVQRFLWYELPLKWMGPPDLPGHMARAAAALLDALGLPRYAAICRSEVTARVHAAYRRSRTEGLRAFREAEERSGIRPPDLEDFAWGIYMGLEEAAAHHAVARALEEGLVAGELRPGERGWRAAARRITARTLDRDHPQLPGQSLRTAILTERVEWWVEGARHRAPRVARLRARHANRLLHPVAPPEGLAEALEPLRWLLEGVGEGVALTQAGYLPRALVVEAVRTREDPDGFPVPDPPRSETDVPWLRELHALARDTRAVYRRGRRLMLSRGGREMLTDPAFAWQAVAEHLAGNRQWERTVFELAALFFLDSGEVSRDRLWPTVAELTGELGWRSGGGEGTPPDERTVAWAGSPGVRRMRLLGMVESLGDRWWRANLRLTPLGEATALAFLRSRAAGPRRDLHG